MFAIKVRNAGDAWADEMSATGPEAEAEFLELMYQNANFDEAAFDWGKHRGADFSINPVEDGYRFEESAEGNPYSEEANPLQKGIDLFRDGRFADAILAFEAAVKRGEQHALTRFFVLFAWSSLVCVCVLLAHAHDGSHR